MSLILDALKKSQQERLDGHDVPGLATEHYPDSAAAASKWMLRLPWVGLLLALLVLAWVLLDRSPPDAKPVSIADAASANIADATAVNIADAAPVNITEATLAGSPQSARTGDTVALKSAQQQPATTARSQAPAAKAQPSPGRTAVDSGAVAALYRQGSQPTAASESQQSQQSQSQQPSSRARDEAPQSQAIDIDTLVSVAEDELAQAQLSEHSAPFVADLSQSRKDAIPTLYYSRHDYNSRGDSSVVLNGKKRGEGDNVGAGVKLLEILPDSAVLSYRGEEFRLRALNSWVNL